MQKIETVEIKNYIFFEDINLKFKKFNFFIGINQSGKSLFLKSLQKNSLLDFPASQWKGCTLKNIFTINNISRDEFYIKNKTFGYFNPSPLNDSKTNSFTSGFHPKDEITLNEFSHLNRKESPEKTSQILQKLTSFNFLRKKDILELYPRMNDGTAIAKPLSSGGSMSLILRIKLLECQKERDIFIIEEPEVHIHPTAQLNYISEFTENLKNQFLISTHSTFLLKEFINYDDSKIFVLKKTKEGKTKIIDIKNEQLPKWASSYGAINWYALNYPTEEFHNELYGILQELLECWTEKQFEKYLSKTLRVQKNKSWIKIHKGKTQEPYSMTLSTYIRNSIHHPENKKNLKFTKEELIESIEFISENISKIK